MTRSNTQLPDGAPTGPIVCPECGGRYLRTIVFDHDPACELGNLDDGTRYHDMTRMDADGVTYYVRCIRPHELRLANATTLPWYIGGGPAGINWLVGVFKYGVNDYTDLGVSPGGGWIRALIPPGGSNGKIRDPRQK